jgi:hypothetical protein
MEHELVILGDQGSTSNAATNLGEPMETEESMHTEDEMDSDDSTDSDESMDEDKWMDPHDEGWDDAVYTLRITLAARPPAPLLDGIERRKNRWQAHLYQMGWNRAAIPKKRPGTRRRPRQHSPCGMELDTAAALSTVQFAYLNYGSKSYYDAVHELAKAWPFLETQLGQVS